jgi:purine-nucleoside phosphorylase
MSDAGRIEEAVASLRRLVDEPPVVAIVLGSGLASFADRIERARAIPFGEIPNWPLPTVAGHPGRLVAGRVRSRPVIVLAGRVHLYEGVDASAAAFGVRTAARLGATIAILTNAAGGINAAFSEGALMAIDDHINLTGRNPLVGPNDERLGPRFPDMTEVYSRRLRAAADEAAREIGATLHHGVYAGVLGPSYETPAEIRFLRTIGADAVGMSTVAEAIAARHAGLEVLGLSCISNMAAGMRPPLDHAEALRVAARVQGVFESLLESVVARL